MKTGFEIKSDEDYLHILLEPDFGCDRHDLEALWKAIEEFPPKENQMVLVETAGPGNGDNNGCRRNIYITEIYAAASRAPAVGIRRLAIKLDGFEPDEMSEFFQLVATNRGTNVEFFSESCEALDWLLQRPYSSKSKTVNQNK